MLRVPLLEDYYRAVGSNYHSEENKDYRHTCEIFKSGIRYFANAVGRGEQKKAETQAFLKLLKSNMESALNQAQKSEDIQQDAKESKKIKKGLMASFKAAFKTPKVKKTPSEEAKLKIASSIQSLVSSHLEALSQSYKNIRDALAIVELAFDHWKEEETFKQVYMAPRIKIKPYEYRSFTNGAIAWNAIKLEAFRREYVESLQMLFKYFENAPESSLPLFANCQKICEEYLDHIIAYTPRLPSDKEQLKPEMLEILQSLLEETSQPLDSKDQKDVKSQANQTDQQLANYQSAFFQSAEQGSRKVMFKEAFPPLPQETPKQAEETKRARVSRSNKEVKKPTQHTFKIAEDYKISDDQEKESKQHPSTSKSEASCTSTATPRATQVRPYRTMGMYT